MVDYTNLKEFDNKVYPVEVHETSNLFKRIEPLMTPSKLVTKYLSGIVLDGYTTDQIQQEIEYAMNEMELMLGIDLVKTQYMERLPFDRNLYKAFVYCKCNHGPILSVEELSITSSNGEMIYKLPPTWLEMGQAHRRQINLIPILSIFGATGLTDGQPSNAGLVFLQAINNFTWLPAFWKIKYTAGVSKTEGQVPIVVNDLIGMTATIEILSSLQAKILYNQTSISQDSISQSVSGAAGKTYQPRIDELKENRERMMRKVKAKFLSKYHLSNI
jgi:hypothetical protein